MFESIFVTVIMNPLPRYGSGTDLEILVIALLHCTFLLPVVSIQVYFVEV